ncbi:hypothetical protein ACIQUY_31060 [Streptomyces sp. NPDC090231]|uniref:hypothetical protein n=1 Tax=unclassified Streptomyces TaxID=2593676 RepID=UPI0038091854
MPDPTLAARSLSQAIDSAESRQISEEGRDFIEKLTFATADEILTMLRELLAEDWMALPPWARNLAYRLACLQRPDDPPLLRPRTCCASDPTGTCSPRTSKGSAARTGDI